MKDGKKMKGTLKDSRIGSLASTALETVLGLPAPALFTLVTLNSYSTSSTSPSTKNFVSENNKHEDTDTNRGVCIVNSEKKTIRV